MNLKCILIQFNIILKTRGVAFLTLELSTQTRKKKQKNPLNGIQFDCLMI